MEPVSTCKWLVINFVGESELNCPRHQELIGHLLYARVIYDKHVVKNRHKKDMCYDEIGLYAQYIDTIVILIINKIERGGST